MYKRQSLPRKTRLILSAAAILLAALACSLPTTTIGEPVDLIPPESAGDFFPRPTEGPYASFDFLPVLRSPGTAAPTPTPDPERSLPALRTSAQTYTVQANDTLAAIARRFGVTLEMIVNENALDNPDMLTVGQTLQIPPPLPGNRAPDFKLIPDSELVNGPYNAKVDLPAYIQRMGGYLAGYSQDVDGEIMTGTEVVTFVARNYSVNPRLLLAILEYQSGWLTRPAEQITEFDFPIGIRDDWRSGLYYQLAWAANTLNRGYYLWRVNGLAGYTTTDAVLVPASPRINAGTAAVSYTHLTLPTNREV